MLLIYPPAARSSEAPLGIARLAAYLRSQGGKARCLDLNQEGLEFLLAKEVSSKEPWTRGALKRREQSAATLRDLSSYRNPDRCGRAVRDLNRALRAASGTAEASLADYREALRSPLRRVDLMDSALDFESSVFFPLYERRVGPELAGRGEILVGISLCYLSQALCAFALAGYIRSRRPDLRLILGGSLVSSWLAGGAIPLSENFDGLFTALISGQGEVGLGSLLGLDGGAWGAAPDFDDFAGLGYFAPVLTLPYNFSSGCPWKRCSFCPEKAEDQPYRGARAPAAMGQLRVLGEKYHPGLFHFTDNEISPLYLSGLAMSHPGAPWYGFARFSKRLLDPDFCAALAASGCVMLQLGLESGDQKVLDALGKGPRLEEISAILDNLKAVSICAYLYVLFGTPSEDRDAAMRTRDFIARRAGGIGYLNIAMFNLPASSEEASGLETKAFYEGELSLYSEFRHPGGWGRSQVRSFLSKDFGAVPEIRAILNRTPPVFTSSHAPFFLPQFSRASPAQSLEKRFSAPA